MMTARENYLMTVVEHKNTGKIPLCGVDSAICGGQFETFENGPLGGGLDGFGVEWEVTATAGGQPSPVPHNYILDDIAKWEDVVKFPDLDAYDWKGQAEAQLANADRKNQVVDYHSYNAQFMRLTYLMGFENGMCAMLIDPDACKALLTAITDYKIKIVERVAEYFKPDFFTSFDDVAMERGLFISPNAYRTMIKPQHKRLNDAIKAYNMHPVMHCCGLCESIVPDFIEEGAVAWTSAQPINDIAAIQKTYGDKISVIGGYDTNGKAGTQFATDDIIDAEVKRCVETYGPLGSYAFLGYRLMDSTDDPMAFFKGLEPINAAFEKYNK